MSQVLIQNYLRELADIKRMTGSSNETVLREAFKNLLKDWGKSRGLFFTPEYPIENAAFKHKGSVDGALLYELRRPFGYWEAKDESDDIDLEIQKKFKRGYPQDNIVFEDTRTLVLVQNRQEVGRCDMRDAQALERFMHAFFSFERPEIAQFRQAIEQFKLELPAILEALRSMIAQAQREKPAFAQAAAKFLEHCKTAINPSITHEDVREMLLQHILTEEIFAHVFNDGDFHRHNNIAKELYDLEATFFTGALKKDTLKGLEPYYAAIRASAAEISSHAEKQKFLKAIYENFYQVYNRKAADRLGVVYTPNEIVRFMIESTDWLTQTHFGKNLIHKDVEILDPATGTGTFICELLEYFKGSPKQLEHKFLHELHANEVAILPYYVANLNIEATYASIAGHYAEFPNLCFMDTLDNQAFSQSHQGAQAALDMGFTEENVERIKRQNSKKISVIIGNPPYNANQLNENDNNKNREYPHIDSRIKQTYIAESTAQKTKLYDMYTRFFRWASDRLNENGVLAFVSNSSFIDSRSYDGFRKIIAQEFNVIYVLDLKGNARTSGERRQREAGNVFDDKIRVGIAVYFCVKKKSKPGCKIFYQAVDDYASSEDKLAFIAKERINERKFLQIKPDDKNNWLGQTDNDFETLIPLANKETKAAKTQGKETALFKIFSLGAASNRDEWVCDFNQSHLAAKVKHFCAVYTSETLRWNESDKTMPINDFVSREIKWTQELERSLKKGQPLVFDTSHIRPMLYRPFVKYWTYFAEIITHRRYSLEQIFHHTDLNKVIFFNGSNGVHWDSLAADAVPDLNGLYGGTQSLPLYRYDSEGNRTDNITDWGLAQFTNHYGQGVTKEDVFHYVYAVLHNPTYREKYALNLKREFPRIPLYGKTLKDFGRWAAWGAELMALHIGYESVEPFALKQVDVPLKTADASIAPKAKLKADKDAGTLVLDEVTTLSGVPSEAWGYRLGNRSALEWVLDQYKESKPKDPTIREKFNTYRFADHKPQVIDLLRRVCTVSIRTQAVVQAMARESEP